jgi:acetylglutamate kinase
VCCMQVETLKEDGTVTGGMIPKLEMAAGAVRSGVEGAVILDGRVPHAVLLQLLSDKAVGTLVMEDEA